MATIIAEIEDPNDANQEAFKVFDKDASGTMTVAELHVVMKNLGQISTDAEFQDLLSKAGLTGKNEITHDGESTCFLLASWIFSACMRLAKTKH